SGRPGAGTRAGTARGESGSRSRLARRKRRLSMAGGVNDEDDGLIAGINVTSLVDVTLVLLIIFMVTAKILVSQGMLMDLPKAATGESIQTVFSVELSVDGRTRVDSEVVKDDEAVGDLAKAAHNRNKDLRAVIRAD